MNTLNGSGSEVSITFLGPVGATFSGEAYIDLAREYCAPEKGRITPATKNGEVLKMIIENGGFGAIAMETRAEGRVAEPLESFIDLVKKYDQRNCPLQIIGALRKQIHFCLMKNPNGNASKSAHSHVVAHPKALGACKEKIESMNLQTIEASSNGEAARLIAMDDKYKDYLAIGPREACEKYGLELINDRFEDKTAVTTFYLIGPKTKEVAHHRENRALIVFELVDKPGSLIDTIEIFRAKSLNLSQIHSAYSRNGSYLFGIDIVVPSEMLSLWSEIENHIKSHTKNYICFGPFAVKDKCD